MEKIRLIVTQNSKVEMEILTKVAVASGDQASPRCEADILLDPTGYGQNGNVWVRARSKIK